MSEVKERLHWLVEYAKELGYGITILGFTYVSWKVINAVLEVLGIINNAGAA